MLGFRFPAYAEGIEVAGYHLHFISDDRARGGHVLDSRAAAGLRVRLDPSTTCMSSCRPPSTSAIPTWRARPTRQSFGPRAANRPVA